MEMNRKKSIRHFLSTLSRRKADNPLSDLQDMDERELADELLIRKHFEAMPEHKCPKNVTHEILRMTVRQEKRSVRDLMDFSIPWKISTGFAGAVAIAVLVFIVTPRNEMEAPIQATATEAEVQRAKDQLKWSLAYTSQLLKQSEKKAISEAVMDELPKTLRNTLKKTVPIFKGGES